MSYRVSDTYDGIDQAMRLLRRSMKGMPQRYRYMKQYDDLRRAVAVLVILLEEAAPWLEETDKAKQATTRARKMFDAVR
ncbi:hypothetical protein [Salinispora arenicola]|uniref:Transposase n=1 Tax=Salinispora arenicola TaxID=168697 RepID=A0A542XPC2_SALAC|nr:hypothetical protein [Salinispora arenicola]MCN0155120.1 hypothetical protein [Salinispora arenicola]TQL37642.1 hypothetical protein FB564_2810 [Salinispora arenicola]GIM87893.1 hypothetical protein Sar04_46290 [Salinispora arenicola]